jgi:hypothetical protein
MTTRAALLWTILATGTIFTPPAMAQTYYPNYPVCLYVYDFGLNYADCRFTSFAQCRATASGRGATCYANPYFAPSGGPARRY